VTGSNSLLTHIQEKRKCLKTESYIYNVLFSFSSVLFMRMLATKLFPILYCCPLISGHWMLFLCPAQFKDKKKKISIVCLVTRSLHFDVVCFVPGMYFTEHSVYQGHFLNDHCRGGDTIYLL
jgi:hypothetical protein